MRGKLTRGGHPARGRDDNSEVPGKFEEPKTLGQSALYGARLDATKDGFGGERLIRR